MSNTCNKTNGNLEILEIGKKITKCCQKFVKVNFFFFGHRKIHKEYLSAMLHLKIEMFKTMTSTTAHLQVTSTFKTYQVIVLKIKNVENFKSLCDSYKCMVPTS